MPQTATPSRAAGGLTKRLLVGRAVSSDRMEHTLLPKILALPVFSSDALSSVAYATEEILLVLLSVSTTAGNLTFPIAVAVSTLMVIVILSYRQTVKAYPSGGGAYIVSKENLGEGAGLVAASALLVDYMLTVVVSTVAGVVAITSAIPSLSEHRVALAIGFVTLITLANLRGVKEAGTVFAVPTYGFILCVFIMAVVGFYQCIGGCPVAAHVPPLPELATGVGTVTLWYILRAFSSGSTALTGVEAISNGVPAFRRPQAHNASTTLAMMGVIAITMFLAISFLATHIHGIVPSEERSVLGQIAFTVSHGGVFFYIVQGFTAAILILAANTAYQDFPRLSAILARDRYMPRQFMNRGDRLVFSNGVIGLWLASIIVIYAFDADLTKLIQMYVVGVFTSFTLSQTGHGEALARGGTQGRRRLPEVAQRHGGQRDRRVHDRDRPGGGDRHEVRQGRVALDPGDDRDHPGLAGDPPALHRGGGPAPAGHGPARGVRRQPRRAARAAPRRRHRRGPRLHPLVPAREPACGVSRPRTARCRPRWSMPGAGSRGTPPIWSRSPVAAICGGRSASSSAVSTGPPRTS